MDITHKPFTGNGTPDADITVIEIVRGQCQVNQTYTSFTQAGTTFIKCSQAYQTCTLRADWSFVSYDNVGRPFSDLVIYEIFSHLLICLVFCAVD